jgi:transcription elongation GreA/GreB family factor
MSVAFVREESAEAAQEVSLPLRAISAHPNLVTRSGLLALERALADSQQALKAAQAIADPNDRRRALELAARDVRYFAERVASAVSQPEPGHAVVVAFGCHVTILRDDDRRQTFRIVGEDEADPAVDRSLMCPRLPACLSESGSVRPWSWMVAKSRLLQSRRGAVTARPPKIVSSRVLTMSSLVANVDLSQLPHGIHRARIA